MKMKLSSVVISVLLVALLLTSCSSKAFDESLNSSGADFYDRYYPEKSDTAYEMDGMNSSPEEPVADSSSSVSNNDLANRKIIKTANINFQTKTYDEFLNAMTNCITAYGGYVQTSESRGGGVYQTHYSRSAYIVVRIPATSYDSFMSAICNIGSVTFKSEDTKDVTISYVDTESRIKALEAEYNALIDILEKATKLDDVIQLQSRISEVTYQLETYKSQLRKYDDLISYCTVTINVNEVQKEIVNEERMSMGERISDGFGDTITDIKEEFEDFSVWVISSSPYIIIWAAIIILVVVVVKSSINKHKKKKVINANESEKPESEKDE